MDYRNQPYRDSQRRDHWPDASVKSYKDYALNWSRLLVNSEAVRYATIEHIQWFLPEHIQGNKINVQDDMTVIWLKPKAEGVFAIRCQMKDSTQRIHYKTMLLTVKSV